ncbi:phage integrase Arm DNA-binding domain-containing protein [Shigella dysenteriae]|nr:excisionase [Shigella dysenteriae]EFW8403912.1 integrase [Shigella dysenteriae]EFX6526081.1 integrase [Shigella dysenteriae]EFY5549677.1 tyrosine-type recombinase/integrase [Shigella dysenteriae]EFZ2324182.1 tyrosine-type recombinase/integrase [Shigella dysenteriae]EFZ2408420.1 tyrosine-type recombinase/integrase [Shigella dysenteriae]
MYLTLKEWNARQLRPRSPETVRRWVRECKIFPPPIKDGREYLFHESAKKLHLKRLAGFCRESEMTGRRRNSNTRDLPPNLYNRGGYYSYRDPRSGREFGIGRDKRIAVNEAIAANMELLSTQHISLLDRIKGNSVTLFYELILNFRNEIERRQLSTNTMKRHNQRLKIISEYFGGVPVKNIGIREVYSFLEIRAVGSKFAIANQYRALLSDIFKTAIASGLAEEDPASATRPFRTEVKRSRLLIDEYLLIRKIADVQNEWFGLCMDLALVTGQREGDLAAMRWEDIRDGRLYVEQQKTGAKIRISLPTTISRLNLTLADVLDNLKKINGKNEKLLGGKTARTIAAQFRIARDTSGLKWEGDPPPFHEIRSLSGRLHSAEKGSDFTQALLGHRSSSMTDKYRDGRGREWKDI